MSRSVRGQLEFREARRGGCAPQCPLAQPRRSASSGFHHEQAHMVANSGALLVRLEDHSVVEVVVFSPAPRSRPCRSPSMPISAEEPPSLRAAPSTLSASGGVDLHSQARGRLDRDGAALLVDQLRHHQGGR